ncbi:pseudouridylate synthase, putative [Ricinus communis]|uniref:tRNA pseudouridine synthase n=1 Tax=Ricinus communis TaxID=3988 RepID=B9SKD4_RICCO|nr:pseudouridylate synthase, putative [Ricinus communis]|eukprot:XP_002526453.1 uncharacterized protein LOC8263281 isoform X1 [Ricinus communis]
MTENPKHSLDTESRNRPSKILKTQDFVDDNEEGEEELQESSFVAESMSSNPKLQRYLIAVEYIGTKFAGSQKQLNGRTVVGVLEEAFCKFIGQQVSVSLSSRTDAGVHALSNVCHVDIERISKRKPGEVLPPHEPAVVRRAVNHFLQKNEGDIMVTDVRCVPSDFHARFKAQERTYFYRFLSGPEPLSTFEKDRAWHVLEDLDIVAMQEACKVLVGHHDFSSFRASGCQAKSPIRTLAEISVSEVASTLYFPSITEREQNCENGENSCCKKFKTDLPMGSHSNTNVAESSFGETDLGFGIRRRHRCFVVTARARSFLYHQVRLLVGVLKSVGIGDLTTSDVERILSAKSVTAASPMAPARGLYLGHVKYDLP